MVGIFGGVTTRILRLFVCLVGGYLLLSFPFSVDSVGKTALISVVAFVAGGIRISLGSAARERKIEVDSSGAAVFASALFLGPGGAAGPAALAALGRVLLVPNRQESFRASAYEVARMPVQAFMAGLVFILAGGDLSVPYEAANVPGTLAAGIAYTLLEALLGSGPVVLGSMAVGLASGYALAAAVSVLPGFAVLVPALPVAAVLFSLVRRTEQTGKEEQQPAAPTKQSLIDPATGLANRRYLDMFIQQEISRSERSGQPVTILLIDIDHFGKVAAQDAAVADRCLAALSSALKGMLRDYDLVARYKEDGFAIVLPETDSAAAYETACRLHSAFSGKLLPQRVTFSVGVATSPYHGASVDDLLASAHHALNRANFSGRNCVRSCHELARAS